jgi:hypothetical protein
MNTRWNASPRLSLEPAMKGENTMAKQIGGFEVRRNRSTQKPRRVFLRVREILVREYEFSYETDAVRTVEVEARKALPGA